MIFLGFLFLPVISQILLTFYSQFFQIGGNDPNDWLLNAPAANFFFVLLTEVMTVGVLALFLRHKHVAFRIATALGKPRWRDIGLSLVGFMVYFGLFAITLIAVEQLFPIDTGQKQALGFEQGISGAGLALAFASLVILPPIAEEIMFRGFFYGTLRSHKVKMVWATVVTSAFFGFLHLFGGDGSGLLWIAFVDTFVLSVVLCNLREHTGTIWASIGLHALKNGFVFLNLFVINAH